MRLSATTPPRPAGGWEWRTNSGLRFTGAGILNWLKTAAFWLHLAQNYFTLNYVNTLWTQARQAPWPQAVAI